jgi:hypothetical protein
MGGSRCSESFQNDKKCTHALRLGLLLEILKKKDEKFEATDADG